MMAKPRGEVRNLLKQVIGLARREHGRGLVEHQDARVVLQVARNLHHLLLANAQLRNRRGGVDGVEPDLGQLRTGGGVQRGVGRVTTPITVRAELVEARALR